MIVDRAYRPHFAERLGLLPQPFTRTRPGAIWLHAVSMGEVTSVITLLQTLRADQPSVPIYLSISTVAGRRTALSQVSTLVDATFYAPIDYASCVRRALRRIRPALVIVLETEIWPNLFHETKRSGARLALVNARISDRTWRRYSALRAFFRPFLCQADQVFAQSASDQERYQTLGVDRARIAVTANLKYDALASPALAAFNTFGAEQVWIAASTVGPNERGSFRRHSVDEDDLVIEAFEQLAAQFPRLLLILAPRQPARFEVVAQKLAARKIRHLRRSQLPDLAAAKLDLPGVLLLDTLGELAGAFAHASVAFVGGSIAPRGGHNILEPAAAGCAIVIGPHMENFASIARDFLESGALVQIRKAGELASAVAGLLSDRARSLALGSRAAEVVAARRGVSGEIAGRLWPLYFSGWPHKRLPLLKRFFLRPFAMLWIVGGRLKRVSAQQHAKLFSELGTPVISVGGITVGGAGKTPFTCYLAFALRARGYSPAILTRGYRRRSPAQNLVLAPGTKIPSALTGDEAQIFLRSGLGPIGIGGNRDITARILLRQFPATDLVLLDDGFQHARLRRDFDIVVIDGLDPFGGEEVVPLGRLREPLTALARADAFVVTRASDDLRFRSIRTQLSRWNPAAPVFRTFLIARSWRDYRTGRPIPDLTGKPVGAFCGLGNPENFWQTLESLGLDVVFRWQFADHHAYNPSELQRVAHQARMHGAELLVTTEKDRINCPLKLEDAIAPLDLAWLEIEVELEDEASFFAALEKVARPNRSRRFAS